MGPKTSKWADQMNVPLQGTGQKTVPSSLGQDAAVVGVAAEGEGEALSPASNAGR